MVKMEDFEMKSKRIVYQMTKELVKTDVEDDFQHVLLNMQFKDQKAQEAGFEAFVELQDELRNCLIENDNGGLLELLNQRQIRSLREILQKSSPSPPSEPFESPPKRSPIVKKSVRVVEDTPSDNIKFNIPQLDLQMARIHDDNDEIEDIECVSGRPPPQSSRISSEILEIPDPEIPKPTVTNKLPSIMRKIASRPRPIEKLDAEMQTDEVEKTTPPPKVDMAEQGTNCRLLVSPIPMEDVIPEDVAENHDVISSPLSTSSELSAGEVRTIGPSDDVITVRPDGSILNIRRTTSSPYFGESESDILIRATSSSPLRVAEAEMSVTSTPTLSH